MDYTIVDQLNENQIIQLVELYKLEFWSKERTYQGVVKMLNTTDIIIAMIDEDEQLIGFARILTDFVYRAIIYDVIIKSSHRKLGLGAKLLDAIINHHQVKKIESIALFCLPAMIPFYEKWGFKHDLDGLRFMYLYNENDSYFAIAQTDD